MSSIIFAGSAQFISAPLIATAAPGIVIGDDCSGNDGRCSHSTQVLIMPLEHEFGWMRADISFAVAISILWYGLGGPLAGMLAERFGLRRVMGLGLVLITAGLGATLTLTSLWQLHLYWGLIVGVGTGMLANVLGNYIIAFISAAVLGFIAAGLAMSIRWVQVALVAANPAE